MTIADGERCPVQLQVAVAHLFPMEKVGTYNRCEGIVMPVGG